MKSPEAEIKYIEQTTAKKIPVIFGENVILMPFYSVLDMPAFVRLHREDKKGNMCRFSLSRWDEEAAEAYVENLIENKNIYIWSVFPKTSKELLIGFIYLSDVSEHSASINGIIDRKSVKTLIKNKGRAGLKLADEAIWCLIKTCFDNGFERIEGDAIEDDREAIALHKRLGFTQEALLRKAVKIDNEYKNLVISSILKEEFNRGKIST